MKELILTVDENDNVTGTEEKVACHRGDGILHRAFHVMVFNSKGELLLTKRSAEKMLWPGIWDGTIASHVHDGEGYEDAAIRRIPTELGVICHEVAYLFKFRYHIRYKDVGAENEICAVLSATLDSIFPNEDEVSEYKFISIDALARDVKLNEQHYAPWFLIAFEKWLGMQKE